MHVFDNHVSRHTQFYIYSIYIIKGYGITDPARTNLDTPLARLDLRRFYSSLCRQWEALSVNLLINELFFFVEDAAIHNALFEVSFNQTLDQVFVQYPACLLLPI